ncbi:MAG: phospholipase D family protein [Gordonia sp. (in: high G+C Gram-positive bacteria)]
MLAPDQRSTLTEHLRLPDDATLLHAMATTFSLDLFAALLPPLALSSDTADLRDPMRVLAAVRNRIDQIDIFHQAGQVPAPRNPESKLFTLLEPAIHAVIPPPGRLFHPKLWFICWEQEGSQYSRLVVSTRNLTWDSSWDAVVSLDGTVETRNRTKNEPLLRIFDYATENLVLPLPPARRKALTELRERIHRTAWAGLEQVEEFRFHALSRRSAKPDMSGTRQLIVSPFLGGRTVTRVKDAGRGELHLVSTQAAIDLIEPDTLRGVRAYAFDPLVGRTETDGTDSAVPAPASSRLHAKLYCVERGFKAHLFIGSANATDAAFGGNIEFLLELVGPKRVMGIDQLLGENGFGKVLTETSPTVGSAEQDDAERELAAALRALATHAMRATVTDSDDGDAYTVTLTGQVPPDHAPWSALTCAPLTRTTLERAIDQRTPFGVAFEGLSLVDLTGFFLFRAKNGSAEASTVIQAELIGAPEDHAERVLSAMIGSPEAFVRLVYLLLAFGSSPLPEPMDPESITDEDGRAIAGEAPLVGLFETILRAMTRSPTALDRLTPIVESIIAAGAQPPVLPIGFAEFWNSVTHARKAAS